MKIPAEWTDCALASPAEDCVSRAKAVLYNFTHESAESSVLSGPTQANILSKTVLTFSEIQKSIGYGISQFIVGVKFCFLEALRRIWIYLPV